MGRTATAPGPEQSRPSHSSHLVKSAHFIDKYFIYIYKYICVSIYRHIYHSPATCRCPRRHPARVGCSQSPEVTPSAELPAPRRRTRANTPTDASFQIRRKSCAFTVSAVDHSEIYTILAKRTELYCIHDAIKHFTRNQCKTDEA